MLYIRQPKAKMPKNYIQQAINLYVIGFAEGIDGLKDRPRSGRPSFLSHGHKARYFKTIPSNTVTIPQRGQEHQLQILLKKDLAKALRFTIFCFSFQKGKGYFPEIEDRTEKVEELKKNFKLQKVVFQDEASLSNTATVSYNWSKRGKQPKICQPQRKRERRTIFGCVSPKNGKLVRKRKYDYVFSVFAYCGNGKKVYMVLDNVRYHHAKRLKPILARYKHRIELIFLPPY